MKKETECLAEFAVSEQSASNAWKELVLMISKSSATSPEDISNYLEPIEDDYLETYHSTTPNNKKKNGTWRRTKLLPNAYRSAKSVIINASAYGVGLMSMGDVVRGKSEVQRSINAFRRLSIPTPTTTSLTDTFIEAHCSSLQMIAGTSEQHRVATMTMVSKLVLDISKPKGDTNE